MQAGKRHIKDGKEFDKYFPKPAGNTITTKKWAELPDTLALIPEVVQQYGWQTEGIAKVLKGKTTYQSCKNLWEFCYTYIQYNLDHSGIEQIRTPARAWSDRKSGIDCDCFAVFIASTLISMGIRGIFFRVTKYPSHNDPNPPYRHIYVVVKDGNREIILDPVTDSFDFEVPYLRKLDKPMELQILNGIPQTPSGRVSFDYTDMTGGQPSGGLGAINKARGLYERDKASGKIPAHFTFEDWQRWQRDQFTQQHGMTPEQWAEKVRQRVQNGSASANAQTQEQIKKAKAELNKRGVAFPQNATLAQLLELLNQNPPRSRGGKIVNAVNRANPVGILLRTGILLAMKINYFGISKKLRWGYLSSSHAQRMGLNMKKWGLVKKALDTLRKIFYNAGGKEANLKKAILEGKGNKDRAVGLAGFSLNGFAGPAPDSIAAILGPGMYQEEYFAPMGETLSGLGEPISASAAIAAATAALTAIAAMLKSVGNLRSNQPATAEEIQKEQQEAKQDAGPTLLNNLTNVANTASSVMNALSDPNGNHPPNLPIPGTDPNVSSSTGTADLVSTFDPNAPTNPYAPESGGEPEKGKLMETIKKNKVAIGVGGSLLLFGGGWLVFNQLQKKKGKALSGIQPTRRSVTGQKIPPLPKKVPKRSSKPKKSTTVQGIDIP